MSVSTRPKISKIITMGDSLSDRGTLNSRYLFKTIPMSYLSGLAKHSPHGRFSNGLVWSDYLALMLSSDFSLKEFRKAFPTADVTDIIDAILHSDSKSQSIFQKIGNLNSHDHVDYDGQDFIKNYNEAGMTAAHYSFYSTLNPYLIFRRSVLATLANKREQLIQEQSEINQAEKDKTLVIEWSGANDLISANTVLKKSDVEKAIEARMQNIRELYKSGYRQFILINLPDISMTPVYRNQKRDQAGTASQLTKHFNELLIVSCEALKDEMPGMTLDLVDINKFLNKVFANPEKYGFDKEKIDKPYVKSPDLIKGDATKSSVAGYAFYDNVHPSAALHGLLALEIYKACLEKYEFIPPAKKIAQKDTDSTVGRGFFSTPRSDGEDAGATVSDTPSKTIGL